MLTYSIHCGQKRLNGYLPKESEHIVEFLLCDVDVGFLDKV